MRDRAPGVRGQVTSQTVAFRSQDTYAKVEGGELWLLGMHIPPYEQAVGFGRTTLTASASCSFTGAR